MFAKLRTLAFRGFGAPAGLQLRVLAIKVWGAGGLGWGGGGSWGGAGGEQDPQH